MCIHVYYGSLRWKRLYACVNEEMNIFTPEFWQFVCLIFGRDIVLMTIKCTLNYFLRLLYYEVITCLLAGEFFLPKEMDLGAEFGRGLPDIPVSIFDVIWFLTNAWAWWVLGFWFLLRLVVTLDVDAFTTVVALDEFFCSPSLEEL